MESPFAQHLNTNYAPSDSEVKWLESHLAPHILEVSRLDSLIRDLSAQRARISQYIDAHKALLSPVRRLPPEIVQEICLACLPKHRNAAMSAKEAPLILTRICSAWRALALSTPALWATLHLPIQYIFDGGSLYEPTKWLERSGRCPLSLSIFGARDMEQWERDCPDELNMVFDALAESSHRWRNLDLSFRINEGMDRLADLDAPKLMTLKIKAAASDIEKMKLLTTRSLRSVSLCIMRDFDEWVPRMPLHWGNLTSLTLDSQGVFPGEGMSPLVALGILKRCPRLTHFKGDLTGFEDDRPPVSFEPTVSLLSLLEFIVCQCSSPVGPRSIHYLLHHLLMPQLWHLQLPRTEIPDLQSISSFLGDLATRTPLIEQLSIDLVGLAYDSLAETLVALPQLQKLVVLDSDGQTYPTAATVNRLIAFLTSGASLTCPLLHELQLKECRDVAGREKILLEFARRRLDGGGGHFKRLKVEHKLFVWPLEPALLAPFVSRGLDISISSPPMMRHQQFSLPTPWMGLENAAQKPQMCSHAFMTVFTS
ncbi:hypothetical protein B0H11DRAFT_1811057 [Mycena galericulata]|nr:hypothetical protein B0H11DRAFT_1811057 [Mycena galericulata]